MLVLSRKSGQSIRIGKDVTVTIVRINRNSIRVGIEAPRDCRVIRGELGEREQTSLEFDLEDIEPETFESIANALAEPDTDETTRQVIQMRSTAPLARFLPKQVREPEALYAH